MGSHPAEVAGTAVEGATHTALFRSDDNGFTNGTIEMVGGWVYPVFRKSIHFHSS